MTRKRFIKLAMGQVHLDRNAAVMLAEAKKQGISNAELFQSLNRWISKFVIGGLPPTTIRIRFAERRR